MNADNNLQQLYTQLGSREFNPGLPDKLTEKAMLLLRQSQQNGLPVINLKNN